MIRLGICNELFEGWDFTRVCRTVRAIGYDGLELAPFTLAPTITDLTPDYRNRLRDIMADADLACIGTHLLLAKTEGLHLTSPDLTTRMKTATYLLELARATHDLGGKIIVFGSPEQRNRLPEVSYSQAMDYAREIFSTIMPEIGALDIDLCIEPLPASETNFLNSIPQALDLIRQVDHPHLKLNLDVKTQCLDPTGSVTELISRHGAEAGHLHAQDTNKRGPGMGEVDFDPILHALVASGYDRWVSVEVFDYSQGAEETAQQSLDYLRRELARAYRDVPARRRPAPNDF